MLLELTGGHFANVRMDSYYYIVTWTNCRPSPPEFADEAAADAVADDGTFADFFAYDNDHSRLGATTRSGFDRQSSAGTTVYAGFIDAGDIASLAEAVGFFEHTKTK